MTWGAIGAAAVGVVGSSLLGGGGGSQDQAKVKPWGPAGEHARDIMNFGADIYGQSGINPLQALGRMNQLGYWDTMAPWLTGQAQGAWGSLLDPFSSPQMSGAWDAAQNVMDMRNPYAQELMDMTRNQMDQYFNETVMPGITGDAIGMGGLGGSAQGIAQGQAAERTARALADQQNMLAAQFYDQNLGQQAIGLGAMTDLSGIGFNTMGNAVAQSPGMLTLGAMPGSAMEQIGQSYWQDPWNSLFNYNAVVSPYGSVGTVPTEPGIGRQIAGTVVGNLPWGDIFGGGGGEEAGEGYNPTYGGWTS